MFIDLLICTDMLYTEMHLFKAEKFTYAKQGDIVKVEIRGKLRCFNVINCITTEDGGETFNFIVDMARAELPLNEVKEIARFQVL